MNFNGSRDKVLQILRSKGPCLPAAVAKDIGTNILFASAILAELVSSKQVKVSHIKVGGSPLYYVLGQQSKLVQYKDRLNEKDRTTFDVLRDEKILRDSELSPLMRVSLRGLKDFAVPLEVTLELGTEIFWKWYLVPNTDVESLIKGKLAKNQSPEEKEQEVIKKVPKDEIEDRVKPKKNITPLKAISEPESEPVPTKKIAVDVPAPPQKPAHMPQAGPQFAAKSKSKQKSLIETSEVEAVDVTEELRNTNDSFLDIVMNYFEINKFVVIRFEVIRKNSDIEFEIKIPTPLGMMDFYCRAKKKKRSNDSDLASAYVQGEVRKLPVLFLSTGDLTKKAKEMLNNEFKRIKVATL